MNVTKALQQFPKDLQAIMQAAAGDTKVYRNEAPRDTVGYIRAAYPFAVYTCYMSSPVDEAGEYTADLIVDVWALDSWDSAYGVAGSINDELDGLNALVQSGTVTIYPNGAALDQQEPDPENERVRRLRSQYAISFHPYID